MSKIITDTISKSIEDRLKDPIIGTFAVSFLITNWDLFLILINYKENFHENIFFIKSSLAPFKLISPPSILKDYFTSYIKGWHLLRFLLPILMTYVWLLKWPKWTENVFKSVQNFKLEREQIISDLSEELLKAKEELINAKQEIVIAKEEAITAKEEKMNLQTVMTNTNESKWDNDFENLKDVFHLSEFENIVENKNNDNYLNRDDIIKHVNKYNNLGLLEIHEDDNYRDFHIKNIKLTEMGQYFYKKLLMKSS